MSDLLARLRRLESEIAPVSRSRLNSLRIDFAFAILEIDLVSRRWGPDSFATSADADLAIESAVRSSFPDGLGVPVFGEMGFQPVFDDGRVEDLVSQLKSLNREIHWSPEAVAAVTAAMGTGPAGKSSGPTG